MTGEIDQRASFDFVRYANCWEDADILLEALNTGIGKRYLSIASSGDNSLSLLTTDPELVVAVDLNQAQLACLELRKHVFAELEHDEALGFLGVKDSNDRLEIYNGLKNTLSKNTRDFWDGHEQHVKNGIVHSGKFENYFALFRHRILPLIHTRGTVSKLLDEKPLEQRRAFYRKTWNNIRWRLLFRIFFSRFVMGRLGRDPEFFRFVGGSVGSRILERTRHALCELSTHDNPYLDYILNGNYTKSLPHYLRKENFQKIKANLACLEIFHGTVQDAAARYGSSRFAAFNLSDIFEYMDNELFASIYESLLNNAASGARFAYWNMLVPRECPEHLQDRIKRLKQFSDSLLGRDKAFFYNAFIIEEVI